MTHAATTVPRADAAAEPTERWLQLVILGVGMVLAMSPSFAAAAVAPILREEWTVGLLDLPFLTVVVQLGFAVGAIGLAVIGAPDVIAAPNLTGDLLSDALAAQVGGIGIAPGGNINYESGHALFEATHGTAPKYAGQDKVNPGSVILSGEMMLRYMGWGDAADRIVRGLEATIAQKVVTYDFARLTEGAREVKCSEFATAIIANMQRL